MDRNYLIAVSGKGGVGKTTVAALLVSRLIARKCTPVLAMDADPNSCLDQALGVKAQSSIGRVREEAKQFAARTAAAQTASRVAASIPGAGASSITF